MPRKAIPEKVWQKIRNDWAAGIPITTLADIYGISKQTVYNKKTQEKAQEAADGRVVEYIEQTEKSMKGILERHKNISERIAGLLDDVVSKIENMDESPQKVLHALKTASDVASTLQKNERRSWGMDEKQGVSTLEDFLDKQEGKLTVINGDK